MFFVMARTPKLKMGDEGGKIVRNFSPSSRGVVVSRVNDRVTQTTRG